MDDRLQYAPESLAFGRSPECNDSQDFFVYQAVSTSKSLMKLKVITRTPQEAIRIFSRIYRIEPRQVVIWYSYPLQS